MSALFNGRKGAKEIQQPTPVFFTPKEENEMAVGYKYRAPDRTESDELIENIRQTIDEIRQTKERLKIVLEAREEELANTKAQLRECVRELCRMCGDDQHPENGTCETCQWRAVREEEE